MKPRAAWLILICVVCCCAASAAGGEIKVGWAERSIAPDFPVEIPGQRYRRVSEGVLDSLVVTALALDDGKEAVIFVSADLIGTAPPWYNDLLAHIAKTHPEIPAERIVINATHTHTGIPLGLRKDLLPTYRFFRDRVVEAVAEAWKSRAPAALARGTGYARVGSSRRVVYLGPNRQKPDKMPPGSKLVGTVGVYGQTNRPDFSHMEQGGEPVVHVIYTFDRDGKKLTGALINASCPSQCSENLRELSGDYWHDVRAAIRAKHGNIPILTHCGAAGDLSPHELLNRRERDRRWRIKYGRAPAYRGEFERREIAEEIGRVFDEVLAWARKDLRTEAPIRFRIVALDLPLRTPTKEEYLDAKEYVEVIAPTLEPDPSLPESERTRYRQILRDNVSRYRGIIAKYEKSTGGEIEKSEIRVIALGDAAFVTCNFELFSEFMHRIQGRSPYSDTMVVQLTASRLGSWQCYLAPERSERNRGYGAIPFSNRIAPAGGQKIVDAAVETLEEFRKSR